MNKQREKTIQRMHALPEVKKQEIEALYAEGKTQDQVAFRSGVARVIVAALLNSKGLVRTNRQNAHKSPWKGYNEAHYAEVDARKRQEEA